MQAKFGRGFSPVFVLLLSQFQHGGKGVRVRGIWILRSSKRKKLIILGFYTFHKSYKREQKVF